MRARTVIALPFLLLTGCGNNRDTAGARVEVTPSGSETVKASFNDLTLKNAVEVKGQASRVENGFLVVQLRVQNTKSKNLPCEWRASFYDKDGMEMTLAANPWTPVVLGSNVMTTLEKTAPTPGAVRAEFYFHEASPIRK